MLRKFVAAALLTLLLQGSAFARHSSYSPMAPRQLSQQDSQRDYTYGLSVLPGNSIDAIEPVNRYVGWNFDYYVLDRYMLRPLAHGYRHLPQFVQSGVGNFFGNIDDLTSSVNNLVLGEVGDSGLSVSRFALNSTVGLLGLVDVAGYLGIEPHRMKFSTVAGRAGADQGAFIMMPFTGPTTERDLHGNTIDSWPYYLWTGPFVQLVLRAVNGVHDRSRLVDQEDMIDNALDPYAQTRQIYLMYQQGKVDPQAAERNEEEELDESFLDEIDSL